MRLPKFGNRFFARGAVGIVLCLATAAGFAGQEPFKEACFYRKLEESEAQCLMCPQKCLIVEGTRGVCRNRENRGGTLYALTYGRPCAISVEPIEKAPFFLGRQIEKIRAKLEAFVAVQLGISLLFPLMIYLTRIFKGIIGVPVGEGLGAAFGIGASVSPLILGVVSGELSRITFSKRCVGKGFRILCGGLIIAVGLQLLMDVLL